MKQPYGLFLVILLGLSHLQTSAAQEVQLEKIQVLEHGDHDSLVDFIPSVTKLNGDELRQKRRSTIGDTLQSEAGVNSTNFGPNASSPVIRGLDGSRIRVLQNGLGTLDASTQSADHNIPIDPILVDQIEIVRGPMSLLYGSSAVGGVVNIVTNRIHHQFSEGLLTEIQSQGETVNRGISSSARMDYGKNQWMLHLDGSNKNLQNQKIPGYARTPLERSTSDLESGETEPFKELINSESNQNNVGTGVTKFFDKGFLGVSYNFFQNNYGAVKEQLVDIKMQQNRLELNGEYQLNSFFSKVKLKSIASNYHHKEVESGEVGTIFNNKGNESRLELINQQDNWRGVSGAQTQIYDFSANGNEAFLPVSKNKIFSLFTYQEYVLPKHTYSVGARVETTEIDKKNSSNFAGEETFRLTNYSGSLAHLYKWNDKHSVSLSYSYTERAPTFQELFANGAHIATGNFERGSNSLKEENAHALEVSLKQKTESSQLVFNVYSQFFQDFISLSPTGDDDADSGLPIYEYKQVNAQFYGLDFEGKHLIAKTDAGDLKFKETFDFVRAKNTTENTNLPRISPARIGTGLEFSKDRWSTDVEVQYVFQQTKLAANETKTDDYFLTNVGGQYSIQHTNSKFDVFLRLRNVFDIDARNHVSILKDVAPLPGRNLIVGIQWLL
ncbi:MAG: TonB-dependent receptor [Bacteriovoracaceae bacterium]|nr:TonB-dependent receptor [Bacteriovoracaceae bacterium]